MALKEQLTEIREEYKQNKEYIKTIKQGKDVAESLANLVDKPLREALQQKIDPKSVDIALKVLRTSGKLAGNAIPVLNAINTVSTVYEVGKAVFPEHAERLENYVSDTVQTHVNAAKESLASIAIDATTSFKARYVQQIKEQSTHIELESGKEKSPDMRSNRPK